MRSQPLNQLLLLLLLAVLSVGTVIADHTTASDARPICELCKCETALINCGTLNLTSTFSAAQWNVSAITGGAAHRTLNFENNAIRNVSAWPALGAVRVLNLRENHIERIAPNAFRELDGLEELDLSHNLLTFQAMRPDVFDGKYDPQTYEPLKHLKVLKLSYNRLHELDQDLFEHLPALESLSLDGNAFRVIGNGANVAISRIPTLRYLDLSFMELDTLPEHMLHSPDKLTHLHLAGNLFKTLPTALGYARSLEYLSLDENPLGNLTDKNIFPPLGALRTLSLSYIMTLQAIGKGALSGLTNLTTLICTNNAHLGSIHAQALSRPGVVNNATEEWPPVANLRLQHNNLRVLDAHLLARWDTLHELDLQTNPWQCDCENQWLLDTIVPLLVNRTGFLSKHMLCDEPHELVGQELVTLKQRETKMRCLDRYGNRPERDGAILVGILIGLLVGIPLTFAVLCIYRRGCFGLLGRAGPGAAEYSRAFYKRADMQDTDLRVHI